MKTFKFILSYLVTVAIFYLVGAFISWEFNPANWEAFSRGTAVILPFLILVLLDDS